MLELSGTRKYKVDSPELGDAQLYVLASSKEEAELQIQMNSNLDLNKIKLRSVAFSAGAARG